MPTEPMASETNTIEALASRLQTLEREFKNLPSANDVSMVVFSGELDRLLAAFVLATGAAACQMKVRMFFTFWATPALKKDGPQARGKPLLERIFGGMLPSGFRGLKLSRLNMAGLGPPMLAHMMRTKGTPNLPDLLKLACDLGVEISVCEMSMSLMGIRPEELIEYPGLNFCGVASFLECCSKSNTTLFI